MPESPEAVTVLIQYRRAVSVLWLRYLGHLLDGSHWGDDGQDGRQYYTRELRLTRTTFWHHAPPETQWETVCDLMSQP